MRRSQHLFTQRWLERRKTDRNYDEERSQNQERWLTGITLENAVRNRATRINFLENLVATYEISNGRQFKEVEKRCVEQRGIE